MEAKRDVVGYLHEFHQSVREKTAILKDALTLIDNETLWEKIEDICSFFETHLTIHFRDEEIVMAVAKRYRKLEDKEEKIFDELVKEHKNLLQRYEKLISLKVSVKSSKENFVETFNDILEKLLEHAGKEDNMLYPMLQKYMDKNQIEEALGKMTENPQQ